MTYELRTAVPNAGTVSTPSSSDLRKAMADRSGDAATFPALLDQQARVNGSRVAMREKKFGIWQTYSWTDVHEMVERIALGLAQAGVKHGNHVALIGGNRPRLHACIAALQTLGAIPVPLYAEAPAADYVWPITTAEIAHAIVEEQEQVDKLLEIRDRCPALQHIWFDDGRGMRTYTDGCLHALDDLERGGRALHGKKPASYQQAKASVRPDDVAAMFFTSGTTSLPKGVVHTHRSLIGSARAGAQFDSIDAHEEILAFLPPAWLGQNIFSYAMWLQCGYTINMPESSETVGIDLKEIGPSYYFAPPRIFEDMLTSITVRMNDAGLLKRKLFQHFMSVARRAGAAAMDGSATSSWNRLQYALGNLLVYRALRAQMGLSKIRVAYTAGEAIGPDLLRFFRSIGINLKQLYGTTETAVFVCLQPDAKVKPDTVGVPVEGAEVQVDERGELLVRSRGLFKEYHKNPKATAEALDEEGWYHTGDAAAIDRDGQVRIIDRLSDVGRLVGGRHDGSAFAPKFVENKLKFSPFIKEAVAFGDQRDRVCAFVNIDFETVGNWAERQNLAYAGYADLAQNRAVADLIRACVETANGELAKDPLVAGNQITRFLVLHKELDADDGELTRTRKVRRGFIADRYQVLTDALFAGSVEQHVETEITFEDGRKGRVSATVAIHDAETFQ